MRTVFNLMCINCRGVKKVFYRNLVLLFSLSLFIQSVSAQKNDVEFYKRLYSGEANDFSGEGQKWQKLPIASITSSETFVNCVAFHPEDPKIAVAGLRPQGLFITKDGGKSWTHLKNSPKTTESTGANFRSIIFSPHEGHRLYVGYENSGFFWSDDLLETPMHNSKAGLKSPNIVAISIHPNDPQVIYVGTDNGLHISRNGGQKWQRLSGGLPIKGRPSCTEIIFDKFNPDILYATFVDSGKTEEAGIYKSIDGGQSWSASNKGLKIGLQPLGPNKSKMQHESAMSLVQIDIKTLYLGTTLQDLQKSIDGGQSWGRISSPQDGLFGTVNSIVTHPNNSKLIFAGMGWGAVCKSEDRGKTWSLFSNGLRFGNERSSKELFTKFRGKDGKEILIPVRSRTSTNSIYSLMIHPDGNSLWACTGAGLYVVPLKKK